MGKCGKPRPYDTHKQKSRVNQKNPMNDISQKKLHVAPTVIDFRDILPSFGMWMQMEIVRKENLKKYLQTLSH